MLHAICFLASFATAVRGAVTIIEQKRALGNWLIVGGLLLLCLFITLDYITEQIQKRTKP